MRIISRKRLRVFWMIHRDAEEALRMWFAEASRAGWMNSAEIKARYPSASIVNASRVVFNMCGNRYRLVVRVRYVRLTSWGKTTGRIHIRFIGTHEQYDRINALEA